jgi:hypothetical protein
MIPITPEMISLVGGTVAGYAMKLISLHMQDRLEQHKMWMETVKIRDDSADKAIKRVPNDKAGFWIRRLIILAVIFALIIGPYFLALIGKPVIIEVSLPVKEHIFGLFSTGGKSVFYELNSYLMITEFRSAFLLIIGMYFGTSFAKRP